MTLREIVSDITEKLNAYSDDNKIEEEHLVFVFNNKRNLYLKNYMSNLRKEIPKEAIQLICVDLVKDESCTEDMYLLKSTIKIPATLENTGRSNIVRVFTKNLEASKYYQVIDYHQLLYAGKECYQEKQVFVAIDPDSYLVVYNKSNLHITLNSILIEGVFENPEEAYNLSCDNANNTCDFYDSQYPIESSLIDLISREITQELLLKYQIPEDKINNAEFENVGVQRKE